MENQKVSESNPAESNSTQESNDNENQNPEIRRTLQLLAEAEALAALASKKQSDDINQGQQGDTDELDALGNTLDADEDDTQSNVSAWRRS